MAYELDEDEHPLKDQFVASSYGSLIHFQTSLCVKIIPNDQLMSDILKNQSLLGIFSDCSNSSFNTFAFRKREGSNVSAPF